MTKVLLIRHRQVEGIEPPRFRGREPLELTDQGRAEAVAVAKRIASRWQPLAQSTPARWLAALELQTPSPMFAASQCRFAMISTISITEPGSSKPSGRQRLESEPHAPALLLFSAAHRQCALSGHRSDGKGSRTGLRRYCTIKARLARCSAGSNFDFCSGRHAVGK
jgi:hypothetical protein